MMSMTMDECGNHFTDSVTGTRFTFGDLRWSEFLEVMEFLNGIADSADNPDVIWHVFGQYGSQDYYGDPTFSNSILLKVEITDRDDLVMLMKVRFYQPKGAIIDDI